MSSYYNPRGYVPGGSSLAKARAITALARRKPVVARPVARPAVRPVVRVPATPPPDPFMTRATNTVAGLYNPLMAQLGSARAMAESRTRQAAAAQMGNFEGALRTSGAQIPAAYDSGIAQAAKVNEAVANRLAGQGQTAGNSLAAQLAQIQADPAGASNLVQAYLGASNAGFARDSADIQNLIAQRSSAAGFQAKLPAIARLASKQAEEAALSQQRGYFAEQESGLRQQALDQQLDLYNSYRGEAMQKAQNAEEARQNLLEIAQRERASIRALQATATTAAEKLAYQQKEKALDRQLKIDLANVAAQTKLDVAGINQAGKTPKVASGPNMKYNPDGTVNPNYVPPAKAGAKGNGNDTWKTAGSAKRNRVIELALTAVINPNNISAIRGTPPGTANGVMIYLMNKINSAMKLGGVPEKEIWGPQATQLRRAILQQLVGKRFTDAAGRSGTITQEDVTDFIKPRKATTPSKVSGR